jgi:putative ABC transport system permease protein
VRREPPVIGEVLAGIVLGISVLASLLGIWRAMKVQPNEVIA